MFNQLFIIWCGIVLLLILALLIIQWQQAKLQISFKNNQARVLVEEETRALRQEEKRRLPIWGGVIVLAVMAWAGTVTQRYVLAMFAVGGLFMLFVWIFFQPSTAQRYLQNKEWLVKERQQFITYALNAKEEKRMSQLLQALKIISLVLLIILISSIFFYLWVAYQLKKY